MVRRTEIILLLAIPLALSLLVFFAQEYFWVAALSGPLLLSTYFFRDSRFVSVLFLAGTALVFTNPDGVSLQEIIYYSIFLVFILVELIPSSLSNKFSPINGLDLGYIIIVIVFFVSTIIGIILNGSATNPLREIFYYIPPFLLFFPLKRCFKSPRFSHWILGIIGLLCLFLSVRNVLKYREMAIAAVMEWELNVARSPNNEFTLMVGLLLGMAFVLTNRTFYLRIAGIALFSACAVGIVLSMSRGFWLASALAILVLALLSDTGERNRLIKLGAGMVVPGVLMAAFFFPEALELVYQTGIERISSIFRRSMDISVTERIHEARQIWSAILERPISGHGIGSTYLRYYIQFFSYRPINFIHNGYLGLAFKLGIPGAIVVIGWICYLFVVFRRIILFGANPTHRSVALAFSSLIVSFLFVNITNTQFQFVDGFLFLAVSGAAASAFSESISQKTGL